MNALLTWFSTIKLWLWGLLSGLFLLALSESFVLAGQLFPVSFVLALVGFVGAQGFMSVTMPLIMITVGTLLGTLWSYIRGYRQRTAKVKNLIQSEQYVEKHGLKSLLFSRFMPQLRSRVPFVVGHNKVAPWLAVPLMLFSVVCWVGVYTSIGFGLGSAVKSIELWSTRAGYVVWVIFISVVVISLLYYVIVKRGRAVLHVVISLLHSLGLGLWHNHYVQLFAKRYPRIIVFLKNRFVRNSWRGLPLTLLLGAFVYGLLLLSGVVRSVIVGGPLQEVDANIQQLLVVFRYESMVTFFMWVTVILKWQFAIPMTVLLCSILFMWHKRLFAAGLFIAMVGQAGIMYFSKLVVARPRPFDAVYTETSFSFPSGHAMGAMVFFGFLAYFAMRHFPRWRDKINACFAALIPIILIGFSRLYLGVHYVSDVLGGFVLGALWLILVIAAMEAITYFRREQKIAVIPQVRAHYMFTVVALLSLLVCYVAVAVTFNPARVTSVAQDQVIVVDNPISAFEQLPRYSETLTGRSQAPLSFMIIADSDQKLLDAFTQAGWVGADQPTFMTMMHIARAAIWDQQYATAPMTPSFWHGQVHDWGFQKPTAENSVRQRHHARVWKTPIRVSGKYVYVGVASEDIGVKWLVTHEISPVIDAERDLLVGDVLSATGASSFSVQFVPSVLNTNASGDQFFTDGSLWIITLP